jgi:uncharacterized protein
MKAYDDVYSTPGAVSWTELSTSNPQGATAFYGALLGWTFETMADAGSPYTVIKTADGTSIGGVMPPPPDAGPMPTAWGPYMTVASADETASRCAALGGKVLAGPMDIPTVGRFAVLQDPQGAVFNVIAYPARAG